MSDEPMSAGRTDDSTGNADGTGQAGAPGVSTDGGRDVVELPDTIALPRLLDFYELQTAEHTRIHEFYDRLREGVLSTTRCTDCGALHYPPRVVCPECTGDDLEYVDLPETGELYAFSAVRGGAPMGMADDVPFTVGVVDLDGVHESQSDSLASQKSSTSGDVDVRLSARIDGATVEDLEIGDPVRLKVVGIDGPADHERVFYRFEPTETGPASDEPTGEH